MLARGLANNITLSACTMNWTTRKCLLLLAIKFQNAFKTYNICISLHHSIPFFRIKVIMRNYYTQKFIHLIFNGLNGGLSILVIPEVSDSHSGKFRTPRSPLFKSSYFKAWCPRDLPCF